MKISFVVDTRLIVVMSLAGITGLFALHGAYPELFDYWPKTSGDLASWMQAIGSVVALGVAIWIGRHQAEESHRVAHEATWRSEWQVAANAHGIVSSVREMYQSFQNSWLAVRHEEDFYNVTNKGVLKALSQMVRSIPLMQLPDPMASSALVGLPEMIDELREEMDAHVDLIETHQATKETHEQVVKHLGVLLDRLLKAEFATLRTMFALSFDTRRPDGPIPFEASVYMAMAVEHFRQMSSRTSSKAETAHGTDDEQRQ